MTGGTGFALGTIVVALAAWAVSLWLRGRGDHEVTALRQEIEALRTAQEQMLATHIANLTQTVTQQLGQVTQQLQTGLSSTGALASQAQKAVSDQLKASTEMLGTIRQQLGEVQHSGRELSEAARTIEMVLGGAQTRGSLGEVALDRMLADSLPQSAYETQHRFSTGEAVDTVVRFREKLLPIDSKFPLDDYRKLVGEGEEARKGFAQAVRAHADSISRKYILPDEGTLEIALMFVPSESVYYELLMTTDPKGMPLDAYCRDKGVIPVSPNSLYGYLNVILMGLRGLQIEENARRLLASLTGLKKQLDTFTEVYEKLGTHLRNAQQSYGEADRKLERARLALGRMAQGALPESATKTLEATAKD
jgi:DNA recombination protein RmuC